MFSLNPLKFYMKLIIIKRKEEIKWLHNNILRCEDFATWQKPHPFFYLCERTRMGAHACVCVYVSVCVRTRVLEVQITHSHTLLFLDFYFHISTNYVGKYILELIIWQMKHKMHNKWFKVTIPIKYFTFVYTQLNGSKNTNFTPIICFMFFNIQPVIEIQNMPAASFSKE